MSDFSQLVDEGKDFGLKHLCDISEVPDVTEAKHSIDSLPR
jgi:hypothetical protein